MSQSDLFSKFFASVFAVSTEFIPKGNCITVKFLLDFNVSEEQIQPICENLEIRKSTGPVELPAKLFKRCPRTHSKSLGNVLYKIKKKQVSSLLVGRTLLLAQLSENGCTRM